jgi:hypothetical protein
MLTSKSVSRLAYRIQGLIAFVLITTAGMGRAQYFVPESVGARAGFSFTGSQSTEFTQAEAFADWNVPLKTESESGWFLQTKLNLSAGWLTGNGINAAVGTLAPAVAFGQRHFPLWLEGGVGPTLISQYQFGSQDFGEHLQFTSFVGVNYDLTPHWRLGYRYQHMSNAGFAKSNPGLNLNMFALSYVF